MATLKDKVYRPDCSHNDCDIDSYYTRDRVFGEFRENGRAYVITERDTPRPWVQYLCNDKIRSAVSSTGKGFLYYAGGIGGVTRQREYNGNYLPRNVNGQRTLLLLVNGREYDFFYDAEDFTCTVRPGHVCFHGKVENIDVTVTLLVPVEAPAECWSIKLLGEKEQPVSLSAIQHLNYSDADGSSLLFADRENGILGGTRGGITSLFTASSVDSISVERYSEEMDMTRHFTKQTLHTELLLSKGTPKYINVISAAYRDETDREACLAYTDAKRFESELYRLEKMWDEIIAANFCELPDKNLEYFLNIWLKNQIYLTFRFDRGGNVVGYRDGLQDSWGNLLVQPTRTRDKLLLCLSHMMADGRCPRQFDAYGDNHDMDDFADSPIWAPIALNAYIKETGDITILDEIIPFLHSEERSDVENHIFRALDFLYHSRGKNRLILVRDGDWADGLSGINQYGSDATSVWLTIAAFHAQNQMAEIYAHIGNTEKAELMQARSAEYRELVNTVGWDGNWLIYAFFEDGEPIGSHKNLEGKIWLNPQTWGIFTGIVDLPKRIAKMSRAVSRYLDTPYGALVNYPPYVFYGERCGRIQRQRPGMFLNSSVYNHAASFKVFSDVARGAYEEALDTISRCLPNHPDNSDTRRTSEPFTVGNVYYGPHHERQGMNLFTWFTATPSWLIHGGFEQILGVIPTFGGLSITPHVSEDWERYSLTKTYRGTVYHIDFERTDGECGIWLDGVKQSGNTVYTDKPTAYVTVKFQ